MLRGYVKTRIVKFNVHKLKVAFVKLIEHMLSKLQNFEMFAIILQTSQSSDL
jgi:hypothetical protein